MQVSYDSWIQDFFNFENFEYGDSNQTVELSSDMSKINLEFIGNLHKYGYPMDCLRWK